MPGRVDHNVSLEQYDIHILLTCILLFSPLVTSMTHLQCLFLYFRCAISDLPIHKDDILEQQEVTKCMLVVEFCNSNKIFLEYKMQNRKSWATISDEMQFSVFTPPLPRCPYRVLSQKPMDHYLKPLINQCPITKYSRMKGPDYESLGIALLSQ